MERKPYQIHLRCMATMCCVLWVGMASDLCAETPIEALQETIDRFQSILQSPGLREDIRKAQIQETILARFDFREMSKRILGPYWGQDLEQQDAFVSVFTAFMRRTFLRHIEKIKDLNLVCRGEEIQDSMAKVVTSLSTSGQEVTIKFHMHRVESGWQIYDVLLDNGSFSIVRSYSPQLQWILQSSSFQQLLRIIREKNT